MNRDNIAEEINRNIKAMEDQDNSKDALPYAAARNLAEDLKDAILKFKQDLKNKPMKKVIRLDEPKEESKKLIELTHRIGSSRWERCEGMSNIVDKIIYLGSDKDNGDMFAVFGNGYIDIAKGHLNDGVY